MLGDMRVLIAESDPIARGRISSALNGRCHMREAASGDQTLRYISEAHDYGEPFDLILLNMELATAQDIDILKFIKTLEEPRTMIGARSSKIILLSKQSDLATSFNSFLDELNTLVGVV